MAQDTEVSTTRFPHRLLPTMALLINLLLTFLVAYVPAVYLTEYGFGALSLVTTLILGGVAASALYYVTAFRSARKRSTQCFCAANALLPLVLFGSTLFPGGITHNRHALTVVGFLPVPVADITISDAGVLWFRDKNHKFTLEEVNGVISGDTEVLVLGIGYESAVAVDPAIHKLTRPRIIIEDSKAAAETYNRLREQGKRVALILHSTC